MQCGRWTGIVLGLAGAVPLAPLHAQGAVASSPPELARMAHKLKPGEWVWAPQVAPAGPLLVYVDLSRQRATVYRNGVRIAVSTISSGRDGYETPTGVFTILQKDADHKSNKYNSAPMPYQQRLTWDGVAPHAGGLPGYPESHGCVHLPIGFARALFGITKLGATVVVQGNAADHIRTTDSSLLLPLNAKGEPVAPRDLDSAEYYWAPQLAPDGPLTIIVSKHDQRVVVLRNGVEIGRAHANVQQESTETQVMTFAGGKEKQWIQVGVADLKGEQAEIISTQRVEQMQLPAAFVQGMRSVITPGTTVLVTQASVSTGSTGQQATVLDADDGTR